MWYGSHGIYSGTWIFFLLLGESPEWRRGGNVLVKVPRIKIKHGTRLVQGGGLGSRELFRNTHLEARVERVHTACPGCDDYKVENSHERLRVTAIGCLLCSNSLRCVCFIDGSLSGRYPWA